jgi:lipid-A-disaccharide synthase
MPGGGTTLPGEDMAESPADGKQQLRIFISAGDISGDRQAAALVNELRHLRSGMEFVAVGGSQLEKAGAELWLDSRGVAVMGLAAALGKLPVYLPRYWKLKKRLRRETPEVAVLVDWGGVNVRLARYLKQLKVPTLYYFPPRSWDRHARREIAELVDAIATPFPWSKHILSGAAARVEWVGHPLVEQVQPRMSREEAAESLGLDLNRPIVALLPGSRKAEVSHCLPILLQAAKQIEQKLPGTQFLLTASETAYRMNPKVEEILKSHDLAGVVLKGMNYDALQCARAAAAVSGTVTLEVALLGIPMVIFYHTSWVSWLEYKLACALCHIQFFGIPNLIAEREIVPELMQSQANPNNIAGEIISLLTDEERAGAMREELAAVGRQLGTPGAARRTADMVLDLAAYGSQAGLPQPGGAGLES